MASPAKKNLDTLVEDAKDFGRHLTSVPVGDVPASVTAGADEMDQLEPPSGLTAATTKSDPLESGADSSGAIMTV